MFEKLVGVRFGKAARQDHSPVPFHGMQQWAGPARSRWCVPPRQTFCHKKVHFHETPSKLTEQASCQPPSKENEQAAKTTEPEQRLTKMNESNQPNVQSLLMKLVGVKKRERGTWWREMKRKWWKRKRQGKKQAVGRQRRTATLARPRKIRKKVEMTKNQAKGECCEHIWDGGWCGAAD